MLILLKCTIRYVFTEEQNESYWRSRSVYYAQRIRLPPGWESEEIYSAHKGTMYKGEEKRLFGY